VREVTESTGRIAKIESGPGALLVFQGCVF
jgi:hypothetical protein